ncbi:MAG: AraC family transcriptional regulator [Capsulimonadaceae bacterium]|nr:AraC family transcriptional regulator [Capsulimonadaceae bacterium]
MPELNVRTLLPFEIRAAPGRIAGAAIMSGGRGVGRRALRVFGQYAIVYLLDGSGSFREAGGATSPVIAGDCLFVYPDIPHGYGPGRGERWTEIYVVFDGPVFDFWRECGLLNPLRPVVHIEPIAEWLGRIEEIVAPAEDVDSSTTIARFLTLLTEIAVKGGLSGAQSPGEAWYDVAQRALATELGAEISIHDVAARAGMSYETFRKRFTARAGVSPARYRSEKRVDAAKEILTRSDLPVQQIAAYLGYSNEFNFSRRFREITGVSPRGYRRTEEP